MVHSANVSDSTPRRADRRRRRAWSQRGHPCRRQGRHPTPASKCVGLEDSFDGLIETEPLAGVDATGRHRHPPSRRHDPRHHEPRQPVRLSGRDLRWRPRLFGSRRRDVPPDGARRAGRDRRRRHARDRAPVRQAGPPGGRRPEDDRQRHRRHHELLRVRHRSRLRDRRHRSPAHDRRSAPPDHGRRGDGTLRRLDRACTREWRAAPTRF